MVKIEFKHIMQAVPAAFAVVRESMKFWKNRNKCCGNCRSWDKNEYDMDRVCTNNNFFVSVNTLFNLDSMVEGKSSRDEILTHETFWCCYLKK